MQQNEYLLAKIGVDTAENEPLEVWGEDSIQYSLHSLLKLRLLLRLLLVGARIRRRDADEGLLVGQRAGGVVAALGWRRGVLGGK